TDESRRMGWLEEELARSQGEVARLREVGLSWVRRAGSTGAPAASDAELRGASDAELHAASDAELRAVRDGVAGVLATRERLRTLDLLERNFASQEESARSLLAQAENTIAQAARAFGETPDGRTGEAYLAAVEARLADQSR